MIVCKLMIPLIWEKLEQEINTAAVASKKAENETTQGGLASAT